jgi:hypothetical protein
MRNFKKRFNDSDERSEWKGAKENGAYLTETVIRIFMSCGAVHLKWTRVVNLTYGNYLELKIP